MARTDLEGPLFVAGVEVVGGADHLRLHDIDSLLDHAPGTPATVLGTSGGGALAEVPFDAAATASALALRNAAGDVVVPTTPGSATAAASKAYVDVSGSAIATWTSAARYFAVDYDSGSDASLGYSDVSMAAAGAVALKTLERLRQIFPLFGNGRIAVVAIKARAGGATYRNIANTTDDDFYLIGVTGYFQLIVRGTGTVASAGATAFANDLADKICCGSQIVAGTNAPGYNPTGAPTTSVIDCVLAGGGAPGLTAEPALIGKRIRFDAATATVALRNACAMIWQNTASVITTGTNLPAVPGITDVFYIEEPGVAVNRLVIHSSNPTNTIVFTQFGIQLVGMRAVSTAPPSITVRGAAALVNCSFLDAPGNTSFSTVACTGVNDLRFIATYTDEASPTPATVTTGAGCRAAGGFTVSSCPSVTASSTAAIAARLQILNCVGFAIGSASYSALGVLIQGSSAGVATSNLGGAQVGNAGSATSRRLRTTGVFTAAINLTRANATLYGIDFSAAGATPLIAVNGFGSTVGIHDCIGSTGNTGDGLNLSAARECVILMGTIAVNTFTGAAGRDVVGGAGELYVHADYARVDLQDDNGNRIHGAGKASIGNTVKVTNDAAGDIGQYALCRATGSGTVRAAFADSAPNAAGVVGVSQSAFTAAGPQVAVIVTSGPTWVQFDAAPTVGAIAYLSTATAGNAQHTAPAVAGTNQKLRLGRILRASGTLGQVALNPESLAALADGLA